MADEINYSNMTAAEIVDLIRPKRRSVKRINSMSNFKSQLPSTQLTIQNKPKLNPKPPTKSRNSISHFEEINWLNKRILKETSNKLSLPKSNTENKLSSINANNFKYEDLKLPKAVDRLIPFYNQDLTRSKSMKITNFNKDISITQFIRRPVVPIKPRNIPRPKQINIKPCLPITNLQVKKIYEKSSPNSGESESQYYSYDGSIEDKKGDSLEDNFEYSSVSSSFAKNGGISQYGSGLNLSIPKPQTFNKNYKTIDIFSSKSNNNLFTSALLKAEKHRRIQNWIQKLVVC